MSTPTPTPPVDETIDPGQSVEETTDAATPVEETTADTPTQSADSSAPSPEEPGEEQLSPTNRTSTSYSADI